LNRNKVIEIISGIDLNRNKVIEIISGIDLNRNKVIETHNYKLAIILWNK
jgi:hypothetical protein